MIIISYVKTPTRVVVSDISLENISIIFYVMLG
jgi:hypothetical protein